MNGFSTYGALILAFLIGVFIPVQAGVNTQMAKFLGHPVLATLVNFVVGAVVLLLYTLSLGVRWPTATTLTHVPVWGWVGGILGASFVGSSIILAPRLGAATLMALIVAGQLVGSLIIDHYGWVGFPVHPIRIGRILGVACLIVGVFLIRKS